MAAPVVNGVGQVGGRPKLREPDHGKTELAESQSFSGASAKWYSSGGLISFAPRGATTRLDIETRWRTSLGEMRVCRAVSDILDCNRLLMFSKSVQTWQSIITANPSYSRIANLFQKKQSGKGKICDFSMKQEINELKCLSATTTALLDHVDCWCSPNLSKHGNQSSQPTQFIPALQNYSRKLCVRRDHTWRGFSRIPIKSLRTS